MHDTTPDQTGSFRGDVIPGAKARACSPRREGADGFRIVFVMIGMLVVVSGVTLNSVAEPGQLRMRSSNPTPYGYTTSLLMFFLPVVPLGWWFTQHPEYRLARQSFWKTILTLIPIGFVLDLIFGNVFFHFPNLEATLGIGIPAVGGAIPVEEFLFYIGGFLAVLMCYIWADEYWLRCYKVAVQDTVVKGRPTLVQFHPTSVALGLGLCMIAIVYKKQYSTEPGGFPWYFIYLVLAAIIPSAGLFRTARPLINWRAFSFTLLFILLVSVIWEVTLAVPYGWWGYQPGAMMGLRIRAWSDLPVEAVAVWLVVTVDTVITYEVIKLRQQVHPSPKLELVAGAPRPPTFGGEFNLPSNAQTIACLADKRFRVADRYLLSTLGFLSKATHTRNVARPGNPTAADTALPFACDESPPIAPPPDLVEATSGYCCLTKDVQHSAANFRTGK